MQTTCSACGNKLPLDAPRGLCPACLFQLDEPTVTKPADQSEATTAGPAFSTRRFGDYELLDEIARGGMGIVYRARQVSLDRIVVVKMILVGSLASAEQVRRFRIEASAAGSLQHPNIVAVHEVGLHEDQHFMVMDYVDGPNLARLVHEQPLPAKKAASYLKAIAEAVQFAHERGILHRDLKPSNVLIGSDGRPRVTDFGLAKRFGVPPLGGSGPGEAGTPSLDLTLSGAVIGSPNYLPPEQAGRGRHKVGHASDVYSLGAILYHLLTARPPFRAETITETLQQVQQTEPLAPRLLNPSVPRDLETICLKCLEKEPAKRYSTAQELADELDRFLRDEPIRARPVTRAERAWRWCRRKPALASALFLILILLLIVIIGSPIAVYRVNQARRQAQAGEQKAKTEAVKSQQVAQFLKDMLKGVGPSVALGRDTTMLREIVDKTAQRMGTDLTNQPEVEVELCLTLAATYHDLGLYQQIEGLARHSLQLARTRLGEENESVAASLVWLGDALQHLGEMHAGSLEDAEKYSREGLAMTRKLLGNENIKVAFALNHFANVLEAQGRMTEAEPMKREALGMYRKLIGNECPEVAKALFDLAGYLSEQDDDNRLVEAENTAREALAMQRKLLGDDHPEVAKSLHKLAFVLWRQGKLADAETKIREALVMWTKMQANDRLDVARALSMLADVLQGQGKLGEAETKYREAVAMRRRMFGNEHAEVVGSLYNLANALQGQGKVAEAETIYRDVLGIQRKRFGNEHAEVARGLKLLADVLQLQDKLVEAETLHREALAIQRKLPANANPEVVVPPRQRFNRSE